MARPQLNETLAREFGLLQPARITEGITRRQMSILLRQAADDMNGLMAKNLASYNVSGTVRAAQMRQLRRDTLQLAREFWNQTGKITRDGMYKVGELAATQALDADFFMGMPGRAVLSYSDAMYLDARRGVESIISRRTDGFRLADRIYRNGNVTTKQVGNIVERGLASQKSAREIAREARRYFSPDVPGGANYAAMRLARTEINNAHHSTTIRLARAKPWVVGFQWHLSGSHPRPDECDEYAQNDGPFGQGTFDERNVPSKPHPHCLCFITSVVPDDDEFWRNFENGRYDDYIEGKAA